MRRLYGFIVTGELLASFAREGIWIIDVESPVPPSATFFTAFFDNSKNAFICVFEDESFSPVAEGATIPIDIGPTIKVEPYIRDDISLKGE